MYEYGSVVKNAYADVVYLLCFWVGVLVFFDVVINSTSPKKRSRYIVIVLSVVLSFASLLICFLGIAFGDREVKATDVSSGEETVLFHPDMISDTGEPPRMEDKEVNATDLTFCFLRSCKVRQVPLTQPWGKHVGDTIIIIMRRIHNGSDTFVCTSLAEKEKIGTFVKVDFIWIQ